MCLFLFFCFSSKQSIGPIDVRSFLCIPTTSSPAEWIFSAAGNICSQKRACLSHEHVDMLTFLHFNLVLIWQSKKNKPVPKWHCFSWNPLQMKLLMLLPYLIEICLHSSIHFFYCNIADLFLFIYFLFLFYA